MDGAGRVLLLVVALLGVARLVVACAALPPGPLGPAVSAIGSRINNTSCDTATRSPATTSSQEIWVLCSPSD